MNRTPIEWTDYSVNPFKLRLPDGTLINACVHKSEGCRNCYAEMIVKRWWKKEWGEFPGYTAALLKLGTPVLVESELRAVLRLSARIAEGKADPDENKIFWNDMTDEFLDFWPDEFIDKCFAVRALTPNLIHQVLTKRSDRMLNYFRGEWFTRVAKIIMASRDRISADYDLQFKQGQSFAMLTCGQKSKRHLPKVWLGVSVENDHESDRIADLVLIPAAVRFISYEPALGPLYLDQWLKPRQALSLKWWKEQTGEALPHWWKENRPLIDWVIVGGESGAKARPVHPDWVRSLRDQCQAADVPFFFKQWGEFVSVSEVAGPGIHHYFPDGATVRRTGKKLAGRLLDGLEWNEFPQIDCVSTASGGDLIKEVATA